MMKKFLCLLLFLAIPFVVCGAGQQSPAAKTQLINQQTMEQVLDTYLAKQSALLPRIDLRFKSLSLPKAYRVPAGRVTHQVVPARPGVIGSRRMTLLTRVNGQIASNHTIRVELEALAEVAVCTESLRRGTVLDDSYVELRYQDITRLKNPVFALDDVIGKRLKRSVRLGEPLQRKQVEFPPIIKRGERVVIQAQRNGLILTAAGEAKQDGCAGEDIRVINSTSHKEIICQVVEHGLVSVEF
jgi:flagella basal body P-ring formation protein FlgA